MINQQRLSKNNALARQAIASSSQTVDTRSTPLANSQDVGQDGFDMASDGLDVNDDTRVDDDESSAHMTDEILLQNSSPSHFHWKPSTVSAMKTMNKERIRTRMLAYGSGSSPLSPLSPLPFMLFSCHISRYSPASKNYSYTPPTMHHNSVLTLGTLYL